MKIIFTLLTVQIVALPLLCSARCQDCQQRVGINDPSEELLSLLCRPARRFFTREQYIYCC